MTPGVSDTAFLVCESRARRPELSRDRFAADWIAPDRRQAVRAIWEAFAAEVYPHDDVEIAVRSRHYLTWLERFLAEHAEAPVAGLGSGLTSYPFLLPQGPPWLEVDLPHLVDYKTRRARELRRSGTLPRRDVHLLAADLAGEQEAEALGSTLEQHLGHGEPSFVYLEGVTYYLPEARLDELFTRLAALQAPGSILAFDFWQPELARHPVFLRQERFFTRRFGMEPSRYTFLSRRRAAEVAGYRPIEITDVAAKEAELAEDPVLAATEDRLLEHYAVLRRR